MRAINGCQIKVITVIVHEIGLVKLSAGIVTIISATEMTSVNTNLINDSMKETKSATKPRIANHRFLTQLQNPTPTLKEAQNRTFFHATAKHVAMSSHLQLTRGRGTASVIDRLLSPACGVCQLIR
jgi:hypothetical protein